MVATKAMLDPTLEQTNIAASIRASLNSNPMTLPITPFSSIRITCIEPINPKPMSQTLSILTLISTPSSPALYSIPIIPPINPIPFISSIHKIVINPTPITPPLVKLALIEIPIAIKLHAFPCNLLIAAAVDSLSFFHAILVVVPTDEPLDRFRACSRKPKSFCVLVPRVFQYNHDLVDQTLVFGREEKRNRDEDKGEEEIFRGGYFFVSKVEEVVVEEGREGEDGEE